MMNPYSWEIQSLNRKSNRGDDRGFWWQYKMNVRGCKFNCKGVSLCTPTSDTLVKPTIMSQRLTVLLATSVHIHTPRYSRNTLTYFLTTSSHNSSLCLKTLLPLKNLPERAWRACLNGSKGSWMSTNLAQPYMHAHQPASKLRTGHQLSITLLNMLPMSQWVSCGWPAKSWIPVESESQSTNTTFHSDGLGEIKWKTCFILWKEKYWEIFFSGVHRLNCCKCEWLLL